MAEKIIGWERWKNVLKRPKPSPDAPFGTTTPTPMIMTDMGPYRVPDELSRPEKAYLFWVGHTNFRLTHGVVDVIESTEGVEVFDVLSPYRFRISVARMFKSSEVKSSIAQRVKAMESKLPLNIFNNDNNGEENSKPTEPTS